MESKTAKQVRALQAHIALNVMNVEQSIGFYHKLFGIEPSKVRRGYAKFAVQNPPLNLTLNQNSRAVVERGALSHLGIQVASAADVSATTSRWLEAALRLRRPIDTECT